MKHVLPGLLLVLHGLAHALPGMRATDATRWTGSGAWLLAATVLWLVATAGSVAAGVGWLGAAPFANRWREAAWGGLGASAVLLLVFWRSPWAVPALLIDAGIAAWLLRTRGAPLHPSTVVAPRRPPRMRRRIGAAVSVALVAYLAVLIAVRPWHMRWGSTPGELRMPLPGDETAAAPNFQIQHAVTIPAPPEQVWPWLAQLGHDRGGFYSYSWLENAFGLHVRNADRIHPEWQSIAAGDSVLATPDDYLGTGRRFGWRVGRAEPNRVLVLETWGAFVLRPGPGGTTRLIVRTRGGGGDAAAALALAPFGLMVFEPAHFIMERRMLIGIRDRVRARTGAAGAAGRAAGGAP